MKFQFILMLVLLGVRILYYITIKYIVNETEIGGGNNNQGKIFNLWLILPYVTEITLNCVIFYFNFIKEEFKSRKETQEQKE